MRAWIGLGLVTAGVTGAILLLHLAVSPFVWGYLAGLATWVAILALIAVGHEAYIRSYGEVAGPPWERAKR